MNLADALAAARAGLTAPLAGYLAHPPAAEHREAWVADVLASLGDKGFRREHRGRRPAWPAIVVVAVFYALCCWAFWALVVLPG